MNHKTGGWKWEKHVAKPQTKTRSAARTGPGVVPNIVGSTNISFWNQDVIKGLVFTTKPFFILTAISNYNQPDSLTR